MSKVEDLAKKYCEGSSFEDACMERPAYIAGYKQAEKDLELTWEDVREICSIQYIVLNEYNDYDEPSSSILYQEVLKRFKNFKERKENEKNNH